MRVFLLTYHGYTTPREILAKLVQRYEVPATVDADQRTQIQLRVIAFLRKWMHQQWGDFDENLVMDTNEFINNTLVTGQHAQLATGLKKDLRKKVMIVMTMMRVMVMMAMME